MDMLVALLIFGGVFMLANASTMPSGLEHFLLLRLSLGNLLMLGGFLVVWQLLFLLFGLYDNSSARRSKSEVPSVIAAATMGCTLALIPVYRSESGAFSLEVVLLALPLTIAATLGMRWVLRGVAHRLSRDEVRRVLIVGSGPLAKELSTFIEIDPDSRSQVVGFVDTNPDIRYPDIRSRMLGTLADLESVLMQTVVDEVQITLPIKSRYAEIQRVIEQCESAGVQSRYSLQLFPSRLARPSVEPSMGAPGVAMKVVTDDYRLVIKRAVDIAGASVLLLLLSPFLLIIAAAVKLTSRGPVLFGQQRYGWRKRCFTMYKFRTMVADAEARQAQLESLNEASGPIFKIRNDPRLTSIGKLLRRTSLDELPQLWNVLRGDMSLVGPRPLPIRDVQRFADGHQMRRFSVPPGVTGLWQVSGRSDLGFDDWMKLDLQYIDNWSLSLDFQLLLRTIPAVFRGTGAV